MVFDFLNRAICAGGHENSHIAYRHNSNLQQRHCTASTGTASTGSQAQHTATWTLNGEVVGGIKVAARTICRWAGCLAQRIGYVAEIVKENVQKNTEHLELCVTRS